MNRTYRCFVAAIFLPLAAVMLFSCVSAKAKNPRAFMSAPLYGMIYDLGNQPVGNVLLSVDGKKGPRSDVTGRFVIPDLERGDHTITAAKDGYEDLAIRLSFLDDTQILYMQMRSAQQLVSLAEKMIEEKEWARARSCLDRAAKVNSKDPVYRYVSAILDYYQGKSESAEKILRSLLDAGYSQPAVYLFLADLYQYRLNKPAAAAAELRTYLELRSDPAVKKRLEGLTGDG